MNWKAEDEGLTKEFEFENFTEAVKFVKRIVPLTEKLDHHPDILIHSYNKVRITLFTHSENAITEKDHQLAGEIETL